MDLDSPLEFHYHVLGIMFLEEEKEFCMRECRLLKLRKSTVGTAPTHTIITIISSNSGII